MTDPQPSEMSEPARRILCILGIHRDRMPPEAVASLQAVADSIDKPAEPADALAVAGIAESIADAITPTRCDPSGIAFHSALATKAAQRVVDDIKAGTVALPPLRWVMPNQAEAKARMLDDAAAMLDTLGIDRASQTGLAFTVQHRIGILNDEAEREKGAAFAAVEKAEAERNVAQVAYAKLVSDSHLLPLIPGVQHGPHVFEQTAEAYKKASAKVATLQDDLAAARAELAAMRADMEAAAGELRVSVKDCAPGTLCGKLLSANVILRHNVAGLLSRAVDADARAATLEKEVARLRAIGEQLAGAEDKWQYFINSEPGERLRAQVATLAGLLRLARQHLDVGGAFCARDIDATLAKLEATP